MRSLTRFSFASCLLSLVACSSGEPLPTSTGAGVGSTGPPRSDVDVSVESVLGDGSASSVSLTVIYEPQRPREATDLDFDPTRPGELWVTLRELGFAGEPCNESRPLREPCTVSVGSVAIIRRADRANPTIDIVTDENAWHFMRRPPGIAFSDNGNFATCGEWRTGNHDDSDADFMGPTLWSSDPDVFGHEPPGLNGSHLDMLHATPWCMGIAHDHGNAFWLFNGDVGAIDWYDFREPHEPGGADHSDGEASRWVAGQLTRVAGVPSHLEYDAGSGFLYIVDTAGGRILRLDTSTGTPGRAVTHYDPQLQGMVHQNDAALTVVVAPGVLEQPSGIARAGGKLFVTDHATSRIHAFATDGEELGSLDTGLPPNTLAGIAIGPDERLYFVDMLTSRVRRVDPR